MPGSTARGSSSAAARRSCGGQPKRVRRHPVGKAAIKTQPAWSCQQPAAGAEEEEQFAIPVFFHEMSFRTRFGPNSLMMRLRPWISHWLGSARARRPVFWPGLLCHQALFELAKCRSASFPFVLGHRGARPPRRRGKTARRPKLGPALGAGSPAITARQAGIQSGCSPLWVPRRGQDNFRYRSLAHPGS